MTTDIVTFTSLWEGWGNQFIEGIFAMKPMVVYEYPVFKSDIKPEGYEVISLGNGGTSVKEDEYGLKSIPRKNIDKAVQQTIRWLKSKNTNKRLERNFRIGKKNHDYAVLEKFLIEKLKLDETSETDKATK